MRDCSVRLQEFHLLSILSLMLILSPRRWLRTSTWGQGSQVIEMNKNVSTLPLTSDFHQIVNYPLFVTTTRLPWTTFEGDKCFYIIRILVNELYEQSFLYNIEIFLWTILSIIQYWDFLLISAFIDRVALSFLNRFFCSSCDGYIFLLRRFSSFSFSVLLLLHKRVHILSPICLLSFSRSFLLHSQKIWMTRSIMLNALGQILIISSEKGTVVLLI